MTTSLTPKILKQIENQKSERLNARRNGKIARLPKQVRDMINRMLDDGLPYPVIIDELGEAGEGLNAQNLTNWVQGGYQDYLKNQDAIDHAKAQMEFASDLLREMPDADPMLMHRACNLVAGTQLFHALLEYGDEALKNLLQKNAAKYLTMLNTVATMANSSIKLEQHHLKEQFLASLKPVAAVETESPQLGNTSPSRQIKPEVAVQV